MQTNRLRSDERGQTLVEFAIVLPILCVLLFGVIQFGIAFHQYVTVTDAARAGARVAAVSRLAPNPAGAAETAVRKSATNLDQSKLLVTVAGTWQPASDVTVEASYPYQIKLLNWVVKSGRLKSRTTERVE